LFNWLRSWGAHVAGLFSGYILFIIHGEDFIKWHVKAFKKVLGITNYIERRIGERRHIMNFVQGVVLAEEEAVKLNTFLAKLPTYLPLIQKNIADLSKAASDKSDPVALLNDSQALLTDLNADLAVISTIVPALAPTAPVVPPAAS
jgi:hypothetical protein